MTTPQFDYAALLEGRGGNTLQPFADFKTGAYSGDTLLNITAGGNKNLSHGNVNQENVQNNWYTNVDKTLQKAVEANPEGEFYKRSIHDKTTKETLVGYFDASGKLISKDIHDTREAGLIGKILPGIVGAGLAWMTGGAATAALGTGAVGTVASGAIAGGTGTAVATGDPSNFGKGALLGAVGAGTSLAIKPINSALTSSIGKTGANIITKGITGGIKAGAGGKDILSGIVSGAIPQLDFGNKFLNGSLNSIFKNSLMNLTGLNKQQSSRPVPSGQPTRSISTPQQGQLVNLIRSIYSQRRG